MRSGQFIGPASRALIHVSLLAHVPEWERKSSTSAAAVKCTFLEQAHHARPLNAPARMHKSARTPTRARIDVTSCVATDARSVKQTQSSRAALRAAHHPEPPVMVRARRGAAARL
jgi:hypothetical protein